jgi:hypothetical protein
LHLHRWRYTQQTPVWAARANNLLPFFFFFWLVFDIFKREEKRNNNNTVCIAKSLTCLCVCAGGLEYKKMFSSVFSLRVGPVSLGRVQINGSQPSFYFSRRKKKWDKTLRKRKKKDDERIGYRPVECPIYFSIYGHFS